MRLEWKKIFMPARRALNLIPDASHGLTAMATKSRAFGALQMCVAQQVLVRKIAQRNPWAITFFELWRPLIWPAHYAQRAKGIILGARARASAGNVSTAGVISNTESSFVTASTRPTRLPTFINLKRTPFD